MRSTFYRLSTLCCTLFATSLAAGSSAFATTNASPGPEPVIDGKKLERSRRDLLPPIVVDGSRIDSYELIDLDLPRFAPDALDIEFEFEGVPVTVELQRHSIRGESFRVLVDHGDGILVDTPVEEPRTYRGITYGRDRDLTSASLLESGLSLIIHRTDAAEIAVQPASDFGLDVPATTHVVYRADRATAEGRCGTGAGDGPFDMGPPPSTDGDETGGVAGASLYYADLGIECDYEFFQRNSNSVTATVNDVELVMNSTGTIYERDVDIAYELATIIVRSDSNDPYSATSIDGRLSQFVSNWQSSPESEVYRDVAHMFSGVNFSGGVIGLAYLGVICNSSAGYGVVESKYTNSLTFRVSLTAHELGHNWASGHCDSSSSTCHIMCSSNGSCDGINGSNLKFGVSAQAAISSHRNSRSCVPIIGDPISLPFEDDFESVPSINDWIHNNGAQVSTAGVNEPDGIRSLNLDASSSFEFGDDDIRTNLLLMGQTTVYASYWVQHRGVEAGESLFFEYLNLQGDWITIQEHVSDGTDQTSFVFFEHVLPSQARYNGGRLRFRANVDEGNDDFFVDAFRVATDQTSTVANDDCSDATEVFSGANSFSTDGSTDSGINDALSCSSSNGPVVTRDVWFTYLATCTGPLEFSTCGSGDFDLRMSVYLGTSGCPSNGDAPFACSDDACGTDAEVNTFAIAGQTYLIRIGSSDGSTGNAILTVDCGSVPPPSNDDCAGALTISSGTTSASSLNSTDSGIASELICSGTAGPSVFSDVWFSYTADCTGQIDISTCGAAFDSRLDVYSAAAGCPSSGASTLICSDDGCGDDASVTSFVIEGQEILIRVGSPDGSSGAFDLNVTCTSFEEPCVGDYDGNGTVDGSDLGQLLGSWGTPGGDLNDDGTTDGADLGIFLGGWGDC